MSEGHPEPAQLEMAFQYTVHDEELYSPWAMREIQVQLEHQIRLNPHACGSTVWRMDADRTHVVIETPSDALVQYWHKESR